MVTDDEKVRNKELSQAKSSLTNSLTDVSEDLINEKSRDEVGRAAKWAVGFEKLLEDPLGLEVFTVRLQTDQWSRSHQSPQNLNFLSFSTGFPQERVQRREHRLLGQMRELQEADRYGGDEESRSGDLG